MHIPTYYYSTFFFVDKQLQDQVANIYNYFGRLNNEYITIGEMKEYAWDTQGDTAAHEINKAVQPFNVNDNKEVNLLKYLEVAKQIDEFKVLEETFKTFDMNNDGFISADELLILMHNIGHNYITIDDASEMINEVTEGKSDKISFIQFQDHMTFK